MTVILQHQFWDLRVSEDHFEVGLSFHGIPERLIVPFDSIKGFFDPSVQFGLQFETAEEKTAANAPGAETAAAPAVAAEPDAAAAPAEAEPAKPEPADPEIKPAQGADIVRLDKFRKK
jgi:hypothetical protein